MPAGVQESPITLKIAYLGGGSRGWARILMQDLAAVPQPDAARSACTISTSTRPASTSGWATGSSSSRA